MLALLKQLMCAAKRMKNKTGKLFGIFHMNCLFEKAIELQMEASE